MNPKDKDARMQEWAGLLGQFASEFAHVRYGLENQITEKDVSISMGVMAGLLVDAVMALEEMAVEGNTKAGEALTDLFQGTKKGREFAKWWACNGNLKS